MRDEAVAWRLLYLAAGGGHLQEVVDAVADWLGVPACITWPSAFSGLQVYASADAPLPAFLARRPGEAPVVRYPLAARDPWRPDALRPRLALWRPPPLDPSDERLFRRLLAALHDRWRRHLDEVQTEVARGWDRVVQALENRPDRWPELFSPLLQVAAQLFLAPVAYIAVPTADGRAIAVAEKIGIQDPDFGFVLPVGRGVGGHVAARGRGLVVRDYRTTSLRDRSVAALIDREDLKSGVIAPWTTPEGSRGALYVAWREPGRPTPWALLALDAFARHIGPWVWPHRPRGRPAGVKGHPEPVGVRVDRLRGALATAEALGQAADALRAAGMGIHVTDAWGATLMDVKSAGRTESLNVQAPGLPRPYTVRLAWPDGWLPDREALRDDLLRRLADLVAREEVRRAAALGRPAPVAASPAHLLGVALGDAPDPQRTVMLARSLADLGAPAAPRWTADAVLYASVPPSAGAFADRVRRWMASLPEPLLAAATEEPVPPARHDAVLARIRSALAEGGRGIRWIGRPPLRAWLDWSTARDVLVRFARAWLPADPACRTEWLETAYHYLLTGDVAETGRRLYLHPNTVRYRLQQLRTHLDGPAWDSDDGRLALLLALAVWRTTRGEE
ncbi:MAG: helix-turn-helix domain-containing protein [Actinomycetia bacterium]|nr:helix-turn-helix domain-containing protein [Actinomycetes bacterium]